MKSSRLRKPNPNSGSEKLKKAIEAYKTESSKVEFDINIVLSGFVEKFPEPAKSKLRDLLSSLLVGIYEYITKELKNLFEPRQYFEILAELFDVAYKNTMRPNAMKEYWVTLNLDNKQLILLLSHFDIALIEIEKQTKSFIFCKSFIKTELNKLNDELRGNKIIKEKKKEDKNYSQKQIAIAYFVLGVSITSENAQKILDEYSPTKSIEKFLSKKISKSNQITTISENKTADTKHLNDLKAAKRLISGKNNKKADTDISRYITAFETAYNNKY